MNEGGLSMIIRRLGHPMGFRWNNPMAEMERRMREFQRYFDTANEAPMDTAGVFPLLNIEQDTDNFYVSAELPGMKPEEIELETANNTLSLAGERKLPEEEGPVSYHRRERDAGSFRRSVAFPTAVDPERVGARYVNGVLTVTVAKAEETKPRQITVKTS